MTLTLVRDGERKTIKATAGELPGARVASMLQKLGMSISEWNDQIANQHGYERGEGVFVNVVAPGGIAAVAGIKAGDLLTSVNRQSVSTVAEFKEALTDSETSGSVLIRVRRGRWAQYIVLNLD